jgi:hypothetical protein
MKMTSKKTLTVVTFEPDGIGVYVDGDLHDEGHGYMEGDILRGIIESDIEIDKCQTDHFHFDRWKGMPKTLEECEEMYGDEK